MEAKSRVVYIYRGSKDSKRAASDFSRSAAGLAGHSAPSSAADRRVVSRRVASECASARVTVCHPSSGKGRRRHGDGENKRSVNDRSARKLFAVIDVIVVVVVEVNGV